MNVDTELDRLFAQVFPEIPKPDPIDDDEAREGICAQGESE